MGYSFLVFYLCSFCFERIAERRQNLVSDKNSKEGIVLHMPTVHPVLLQAAHTKLLDAQDKSIICPLVLEPCTVSEFGNTL